MKNTNIKLVREYDKDANITYKVVFSGSLFDRSSTFYNKYLSDTTTVKFKTEYEASLFMDRLVKEHEKAEAKEERERANKAMTKTLRRYP